MFETTRRMWPSLMFGLIVFGIAGCALATDLLNEQFVLAVGLDPATITAPPGMVLVAFDNQTSARATFYAYYQEDPDDTAKGARNFALMVEPGQVGNEVLDCPVGLVGPGSVPSGTETAEAESGTAATVIDVSGTGGEVEVTYGGSPVRVGTAFQCGDVIEIRLSESGGTATTTTGETAAAPGLTSGTADQTTTQTQTTTTEQAESRYVISVRVIPGS